MVWVLVVLLASASPLMAQDYSKLRVIAFGAHPDDCDQRAGGIAAKYAAAGHLVKFVSVTNGDAGHHEQGGGMLAKRRRAEAREAGRRIGIEYEALDNHDGELLPTLEVRRQIIRKIREWQADIVLAPRPNDYHPDHRYTGVLVQDASYMVTVPNIVSDAPALRKNPVFLYFADRFTRPQLFRPDIVVGIDDVRHARRPRLAGLRMAAVARRPAGGSAERFRGAEEMACLISNQPREAGMEGGARKTLRRECRFHSKRRGF